MMKRIKNYSLTKFLAINKLYRCSEIDWIGRNLCLRKLLVAALGIASLSLFGSQSARAANDTWIGNTDANWNTSANWSALPTNGDSLVFGAAGTAGTSLNNNISSLSVNNLTFSSGASSFTIGGNAITLTGTLANSASVNESLNGVVIGAANTAIKNNSASTTLALGALTQSAAGATVFLTKTGNISTSTTTGQSRVSGDNNLGGWIVIDNGNNTYDWANSGTSGVNNIVAASYQAGGTGNAGNVRYQSGTTTFSTNGSWNSINLQGATTVLNTNGTAVFLDTGGIILSGGPHGQAAELESPTSGRFTSIPLIQARSANPFKTMGQPRVCIRTARER